MNSKSIYKSLCGSRKHLKETWKPVGSGLERHRILPKHQGGTYEESNCTYLTHREHILAHYLLWRIHAHHEDRSAYKMMKGTKCYPPRVGKTLSAETRRKIGKGNKGKTITEETRKKLSESLKGRPNTEEHNRKISEAKKGKKRGPMTEEQKLKISKACKGKLAWNKGKSPSAEHAEKLRKVRKGKKWWNNGEQEALASACPASGWKRGRLR